MIKGKNITLRLVHEDDLDILFKNISNLSNRGEFFPLTLTPQTTFKKRFYETGFWSDDFGRLLILNLDQVLVGSIYYFKTVVYSNALEIGYIIFDNNSKGKGYTTEALSLMVDHLFTTKFMNRIQLKIEPSNEPSIKVALKCGFQFDGTRRQIVFNHGKHLDLNEYMILREDWEKIIHNNNI
ncbi:MAG: GNAT family protein [Bdellovibrionota bacterium]